MQEQSFNFDNLSTNSASASINDTSINDSYEIGYERDMTKNLDFYSTIINPTDIEILTIISIFFQVNL